MRRRRLPFDPLRSGVMLFVPLLLALGVLAARPAAAQVQVEQVGEEATPEVKGASQSEIIVAQDEGGVQDGDVRALIPVEAGLTTTSGNSASIFQDGSGNDAQIRQVGTGNQASASQLGSDNEIVITQGGGPAPSVFGDGLPGDLDLSATDAFDAIRAFSPNGSGQGNLAVAVHEGTGNQTSITQLGARNAAGIRLDGSGNAMNLLQTGRENRFLMDTAVKGLDMNVLQSGSGNSLETNVPVNAEMNGNGIKMVIRRQGGGGLFPLGAGE